MTRNVLAARQSEADHRNLTLRAALGPAPAAGSPRLAERLAANLVDNALRHNLPGGWVEVTTATTDSRAVLTVANTGPVVPAAAVGRLFQPFQRLDTERTSRGDGFGLGLSIVQAIAETHGATITACPQPGGGLLIHVTFPALDNSPPIPHTSANLHARVITAELTSPAATEPADRHPDGRKDEASSTNA